MKTHNFKKDIDYRLFYGLVIVMVLLLGIFAENTLGIGPLCSPCDTPIYDWNGHFIRCSGCIADCSLCYSCNTSNPSGPSCQEIFDSSTQSCCDCKRICYWNDCKDCAGDGSGTCLSYCDPNKCQTTCDGHGNCLACGGDPNKHCCYPEDGIRHCCDNNETCCNGSCCDPAKCETCVNGSCKVCNPHKLNCCDSFDCYYCYSYGFCAPCLWKAGSYAVLMTCNRVDDPCTSPNPDGCSNPFGSHPDDPANCSPPDNSSFLGPCNNHDRCYQSCYPSGSEKSTCDSMFGDDMEAVCSGTSLLCHAVCEVQRVIYWTAVSICAESAYETDQLGACACCDCE